MKEHGMMFTAPMVLALLDGRKTRTRRIIEQSTPLLWDTAGVLARIRWGAGDRIWAKETWATPGGGRIAYRADGECGAWIGDGDGGRMWIRHGRLVGYAGDGPSWGLEAFGGKWRPGMFMPRRAARIVREIVDVRVERLHAITDEEARLEGVDSQNLDNDVSAVRDQLVNGSLACDRFARLWDSLGRKNPHPWASNPWVAVLHLREIEP